MSRSRSSVFDLEETAGGVHRGTGPRLPPPHPTRRALAKPRTIRELAPPPPPVSELAPPRRTPRATPPPVPVAAPRPAVVAPSTLVFPTDLGDAHAADTAKVDLVTDEVSLVELLPEPEATNAAPPAFDPTERVPRFERHESPSHPRLVRRPTGEVPQLSASSPGTPAPIVVVDAVLPSPRAEDPAIESAPPSAVERVTSVPPVPDFMKRRSLTPAPTALPRPPAPSQAGPASSVGSALPSIGSTGAKVSTVMETNEIARAWFEDATSALSAVTESIESPARRRRHMLLMTLLGVGVGAVIMAVATLAIYSAFDAGGDKAPGAATAQTAPAVPVTAASERAGAPSSEPAPAIRSLLPAVVPAAAAHNAGDNAGDNAGAPVPAAAAAAAPVVGDELAEAAVAPSAVPAPTDSPAAPAAAERVATVRTSPAGATATLVHDGTPRVIGATPATVRLEPGQTYELILTHPDYAASVTTIAAGTDAVAVDVALQAPATGALDTADESAKDAPTPAAAPAPAPKAMARRARRSERTATRATKRMASRAKRTKRATRAKKASPRRTKVAAATVGGKHGVLAVSTKPPCDIYIDGRRTGMVTPQRSIKLSPGWHKVSFVNKRYGIRKTYRVKVPPGKRARVIRDWSSKIK